MSEADRVRWDGRYAEGAYEARRHPSPFVEQSADLLPARGRALDLACGAGRNAIYLANRGLGVDAVDISRVALENGRAAGGDLPIRWIECDLDNGFQAKAPYDVIVNIRYVNLPLVSALIESSLRPGGILVVEQHLQSDDDVIGPKNPTYRVAKGTLARLAPMVVVRTEEGLFDDPDGRRAALARLVARKGPGKEPKSPGKLTPTESAA